MLILGIDPGINGCLALYKPGSRDTGQRDLDILDMPTMTLPGSDLEIVDALRARDWIDDIRQTRVIDHAFLELVNAMPATIPNKGGFGQKRVGMGAASAFKFGDRVATIRTVVMMMGIPLTRVVPRVWQKAFGLTGKDDPCPEIIARLPEFSHLFQRKKDDGRADAVLIAIYGALKIGVPNASISFPAPKGL